MHGQIIVWINNNIIIVVIPKPSILSYSQTNSYKSITLQRKVTDMTQCGWRDGIIFAYIGSVRSIEQVINSAWPYHAVYSKHNFLVQSLLHTAYIPKSPGQGFTHTILRMAINITGSGCSYYA